MRRYPTTISKDSKTVAFCCHVYLLSPKGKLNWSRWTQKKEIKCTRGWWPIELAIKQTVSIIRVHPSWNMQTSDMNFQNVIGKFTMRQTTCCATKFPGTITTLTLTSLLNSLFSHWLLLIWLGTSNLSNSFV